MLQNLMKKKTPKKQSMVQIKMPSSEEKVILETKIVEERTDMDFSDFRQMLKNRGLRKPELFKSIPKTISKNVPKPTMAETQIMKKQETVMEDLKEQRDDREEDDREEDDRRRRR